MATRLRIEPTPMERLSQLEKRVEAAEKRARQVELELKESLKREKILAGKVAALQRTTGSIETDIRITRSKLSQVEASTKKLR